MPIEVSHGGTVNKAQTGLQYLNTLTPWNGRGGFALEGIIKVLKRLGDPQDSYPTVHIAGTNGKGSVSSAVASILGTAGYKVGLNTSPHLQLINERIVIDGLPIDDCSLGEFCYDVRGAASKELVELSFHEAITAVTFLSLREVGVDWGVIEVGLGGRLDASNVISRPAATAIVTIDYDHQAILGNTLAEIAAEKAGIIKQGSPLISGLLPPEAERVVHSKARGTKHYRYQTDYGVAPREGGGANLFGYWGKDFPISPMTLFDFTSPLPGIHQGHNLSVAATVGLAVGMKPEVVKKGIESVHWPARLERVTVDGCDILMDCAHNQAGIRAFIDYLLRTRAGLIDLTFGVLDTKNWREMVVMLAPHVGHWRLIKPDSERALSLEEVEAPIRISGNEVRVSSYGSDYEALAREMIRSCEGEMRYVTGSMYMIGKLRSVLGIPLKPIWKVGSNRTLV